MVPSTSPQQLLKSVLQQVAQALFELVRPIYQSNRERKAPRRKAFNYESIQT